MENKASDNFNHDSFINRTIASYPSRGAYRNQKNSVMINIGAGSFKRKGWINLDFKNSHYKWAEDSFIQYDITKMEALPFEQGAVQAAYISHVIEHLKNDHVQHLFEEVRRVLHPQGIFRVAMPNADLYYLSVKTGDSAAFAWRRRFFQNFGWIDLSTLRPMHFLIREICTPRGEFLSLPSARRRFETNEQNTNYISVSDAETAFQSLGHDEFFDFLCRNLNFDPDNSGDHINWWSFDKVRDFLTKAGFSFVMPSSFLASAFAPMKEWPHFDSTRPTMTLYVEAAI